MSKTGSGAPHHPSRSRPDHPHAARRCQGRSGQSSARGRGEPVGECVAARGQPGVWQDSLSLTFGCMPVHGPLTPERAVPMALGTQAVLGPLPASMSQHTILAGAMLARVIQRRLWHLKECHNAQTVARGAPGDRLSLSWTSCQYGQVKTTSGYVTKPSPGPHRIRAHHAAIMAGGHGGAP